MDDCENHCYAQSHYRRNSDEDIRSLERRFYSSGDPVLFASLVAAYNRIGIMDVSFLVEYPEAFPLLRPEWQQALRQQVLANLPGPIRCVNCDGVTLSAELRCVRCHDANQAMEHLPSPGSFEDEEDEEDEEEIDPHEAERDAGTMWGCESCGDELFAASQGASEPCHDDCKTWNLLSEAAAAITDREIGRGSAGQVMCEECLREAGLELEDAVQEEFDG
jgi:hypothetical protein